MHELAWNVNHDEMQQLEKVKVIFRIMVSLKVKHFASDDSSIVSGTLEENLPTWVCPSDNVFVDHAVPLILTKVFIFWTRKNTTLIFTFIIHVIILPF